MLAADDLFRLNKEGIEYLFEFRYFIETPCIELCHEVFVIHVRVLFPKSISHFFEIGP